MTIYMVSIGTGDARPVAAPGGLQAIAKFLAYGRKVLGKQYDYVITRPADVYTNEHGNEETQVSIKHNHPTGGHYTAYAVAHTVIE